MAKKKILQKAVQKAKTKQATKKAEKKANPPKKKGIVKKVLKGAAAVSTGGASLLLDKKTRSKIKVVTKKVTKKAGTAAKKVGKGIAKGAKKGIGAIKHVAKNAIDSKAYTALFPFKLPMEAMLKKKGVVVKKGASIKEVSDLFFLNVIKKEQHLEHCGGRTEHLILSHLDDPLLDGAATVAASAVPGGSIVKMILDFFVGAKKKKNAEAEKAAGRNVSKENELTEDEEKVIDKDAPLDTEEKQAAEMHDIAEATINDAIDKNEKEADFSKDSSSEEEVSESVTGGEDKPKIVLQVDKNTTATKEVTKNGTPVIVKEKKIPVDSNQDYGVFRHLRNNY